MININYENKEPYDLTYSKNMELFISSLKYVHKQQENKKRNQKKLMNLFSVKVQKYDDSSSYNTDQKMKGRKCEIANKLFKKRRKIKEKQLMPKNLYSVGRFEDHYPGKNNLQSSDTIEKEYNSDSSIYTKDKIIEDDEYDDRYKTARKTCSVNQRDFSKIERSKFIKHKFNKQMDQAKSKKYVKEDCQVLTGSNKFQKCIYITEDCDFIDANHEYLKGINFDNSMYNSYKSINSNEKISPKNFLNYVIKSINEDKDLIIYNQEEDNPIKYDETYKCNYSLDHKSRIIYIKTSPKFLSSLSSIFNSKIVSRKNTKNISQEQSKFTQTPQNKEEKKMKFDHDTIIEKLKYLENMQQDKDLDDAMLRLSACSEVSDDY